uniref:hypothetical protein n=1 Tax=Psychrobacter sp. TaxID=56811 RepID=UPI0015EE51CA|nr:hypothetical protein [Psychrobacter sp.]
MNIKIIIATLVVLMLGFIGYNNYSSSQKKQSAEIRAAETAAMQSSNAQAMAAIKKPEPVVDVGVELAPMPPEPSKEDIKNNTCDSISEFSEVAMKARLNGAPIQKMLNIIDTSNEESAELKAALKDITIRAYKQPDYQTEEMRERAIREFALKQYLSCIDAFDKRK